MDIEFVILALLPVILALVARIQNVGDPRVTPEDDTKKEELEDPNNKSNFI